MANWLLGSECQILVDGYINYFREAGKLRAAYSIKINPVFFNYYKD